MGTTSAGLDSAGGLFVDELYADRVERLRRPGRKLAEVTKLAIENDIRSKPLLAALFHIAFIYIRRINRCTDLLIEVNPRHVAFYRRMFGLELIGEERMNTRVGAPAVLLRLRLSYAEAEITRYGGQSGLASTVRSLYPYAYSPREEAGIEQRLRELEYVRYAWYSASVVCSDSASYSAVWAIYPIDGYNVIYRCSPSAGTAEN